MSEARFSKDFRDNLTPLGFRFYRVESGHTSPGIPDIHFTYAEGMLFKTGWIETKDVITMPKSIPYRPGQAPWLHEYASRGGLAITAVWEQSARNLWFIPGIESHVADRDLSKAQGVKVIHIPRGGSWYPAAKYIIFDAK